jgi:hypothetical protein
VEDDAEHRAASHLLLLRLRLDQLIKHSSPK